MSIEHVQLAEASGERLSVRFAVAKKTASDRSPKFRAIVTMAGPLRGLEMDFPIFSGKSGDYSVNVPSIYGSDAIIVAPMSVTTADGRKVYTNVPDPDGQETLDRLLPAVKAKFLDWLHAPTDKPKPTEYLIPGF